ncbi:hypothetical protein TGCAST_271025 [Toxoplasma gondii CAST]|uniref:Uncharacterized protein n=1 Tax=Toxoplasma gondii CAST TaxID=943122 RepID=A0A425I8X9_TOXGO|nr:hypothetical protein TGCAST_271025 [Toxoplasma gondii CAST]
MAVVSHTGEIPALPEHRTLCRRLVQGGRGGDSLQLLRRAKKRKTQQARVQGEKKMKTHEDEEQEAPFSKGPLHGVERETERATERGTGSARASEQHARKLRREQGPLLSLPSRLHYSTQLRGLIQAAGLFGRSMPDKEGETFVDVLDLMPIIRPRFAEFLECFSSFVSTGSPKDFVRSLLIPSTQQAAASRVPPVAVVCDATGGQGAAALCMFQHPLLGVASCGFPLLLAPPSPPWAQWRHRLASRLEAGSVLMTPVRILLLGRCTFLCHAMMHTQHPPNRLRDLSRARKFHFRLCFLHPRF